MDFSLDRTPRASTNIVISETTGRPYKEYNFSHVFRRIALAAGIEGLLFMDLRRTAVVWLAGAPCTVPEIAVITGHQIEHTARILQTYCPLNSTMARNAIAKLEQCRKRTELEG